MIPSDPPWIKGLGIEPAVAPGHTEHGTITSSWSDDDRWTGTQYVPGRRVDVFEDGCVRTTDFDRYGYPTETWT